MKKFLSLFLLCGIVSTLVACGSAPEQSSSTAVSSNTTESVAAAAEQTAKPTSQIKIDDIVWSVEDAIIWDVKTLSFNYTNNSPYTITDLQLKFTLKPDVTAEQLKIFGDDEDVKETFILGYNQKFCDPGETVKNSPCLINGTYTPIENREQFDLVEPNSLQIAYISEDNKMQLTTYDYASKKFTDHAESLELYQWTDSDIGKLLPVPEFQVVHSGTASETYFGFTFYDCQPEHLKEYAEACKRKGFTTEAESGEKFFTAKNADGYKVHIQYDNIDQKIIGNIEKAVQEAEAAESTDISDDTINPEFKETMDSYEAFFDEYIEVMEKYMSAEDPTEMLADYTDYITRYTEMIEKMGSVETTTLTAAETAYYTEVTLRISQKLSKVGQ